MFAISTTRCFPSRYVVRRRCVCCLRHWNAIWLLRLDVYAGRPQRRRLLRFLRLLGCRFCWWIGGHIDNWNGPRKMRGNIRERLPVYHIQPPCPNCQTTPYARSAVLVNVQPSHTLDQILLQIQQTAVQSQRSLSLTRAQVSTKERERKILQLTINEVQSMEGDVNMYKGVGKM